MTNRRAPSASPFGTLPKSVVIGTAGHIDHGKTALIRALTGIDTDRLPEEKRRGITIDLGFASLDISATDGSPVRLSLIDVPGHARFVRNMLAGAGGVDAVLLVISAEEGVKPQTEEHLAICSILGIRRGITVLTKIDAVNDTRLNEVRSSVEGFLSATFLASSPIVCVSAYTGAGVDALQRELGSLAAQIPTRTIDRLTRLPVDRAFSMTGFGAVVTGTLISGSITAGQELAVQPGKRTAKVRGIQMHGRTENTALAATRVALNLARIDASELQRGDMLVEPSTIVAVDTIDAEVSLLRSAPNLKHRAHVHFHAFASECMTAVSLYGYRPLEPGSSGLVRLRLSKSLVLLPGDRFVLRHGSPVATIGGGRVLDAHPLVRLTRPKTQDWLEQVRNAALEQQLTLRIARRGTTGMTIATVSAETGVNADAIRAVLAPMLREAGLILLENDLLLTLEAVNEANLMATQRFQGLSEGVGLDGVKKSELRSKTRLRPEVFDYILTMLEHEKKLRVVNELLFPATGGTDPSSHDRERLSAISRVFEQSGLAAPSPASLAEEFRIDPAEMRRLITILLRERKLVRLGDDSLCVDQGAVTTLKQTIQELRGQTIDVARFKQITGVSRKFAIPLLEYLDRERITRKQGDHRIVL
jgi:selenocysteine-specific elongation factor